MKFNRPIRCAVLVVALLSATAVVAQSVPVTKTNPTKVYMHYMPWFQTPSSLGGTDGSNWGIHWTMANENPNVVDASGKRQIASHYYPMIGPYDSTDPSVLEYHMLLMKYSGIDGVMIDWYGQKGTNGDIVPLLTASDVIVNKTGSFGLGVGVVLEDHFAGTVMNEQANMHYLRDNYFNKSNYITYGANHSPLMLNFGPQTFNESQWSQILPETGTDPEFLPLNYNSGAGANADGQFAWPYQTPNTSDHLIKLRGFYTTQAGSLKAAGKIAAGVAYPGFYDFYAPGGWGAGYSTIPEIDPSNQQSTLQETLNLYNTYQSNLSMLQLATFNDFGEGTMFEPTVENGFDSLHQIQVYTGTPYGTDELQLIYELYLARKKYAGHAATQAMLDTVSADLDKLDVSGAEMLLSQASPAGDYNGDGVVDANDYNVWKSAFGSSTIIYGSGADGNYDGVIDASDYTIWRDHLGAGGSGALTTAVPEPSALALVVFAVVAGWSRKRLNEASTTALQLWRDAAVGAQPANSFQAKLHCTPNQSVAFANSQSSRT